VLIQQYLDESYAVEYSIPSCRRLLNQAGLSYQNLARQPLNLMLTSKTRFVRDPKKRREMDATVVSFDQTEKSVHVEPRATLFPCGSRPSVELSRQRGWMPLSGATTEGGTHFSLD